jgi:outer membrane protein OmpA-like peptidoglycan-associated protein
MPIISQKHEDHVPVQRISCAQFVIASLFTGTLALGFLASQPSFAQSTTVIGGSGKSSVEVNLDILDPSSASRTQYGRQLKMPGMGKEGPVTLRMPGGSASKSMTASTRSMPRLKLKRPGGDRLKIANRAPALPARVTATPIAPVARVTPPPQKAMPMAKAAMPSAPKPISRPAAPKPMPAPKPVQVARQSPAAAPPPPPPPAPAPAPKKAAPKPAPMPAPVVVKPMVAKPAPAPAPVPVVPAPKAAPAEKVIASLPRSVNVSTPGLAMRVGFSGNSTRISADEKVRLAALADKMAGSGDRLQLKSFAGGSGETPSASRRRSLSRALAVRSYLIEKGVRSTRIDVRALGMAADSGPSDRVDVIILVR